MRNTHRRKAKGFQAFTSSKNIKIGKGQPEEKASNQKLERIVKNSAELGYEDVLKRINDNTYFKTPCSPTQEEGFYPFSQPLLPAEGAKEAEDQSKDRKLKKQNKISRNYGEKLVAERLDEKKLTELKYDVKKSSDSLLLEIGYIKEESDLLLETCQYCKHDEVLIYTNYCGHGQCGKCYSRYFEKELEKGDPKIMKCFKENCRVILSVETIKDIVQINKQFMDYFTKKMMIQYLSTHPMSLITCKKNSCLFFVEVYQTYRESEMFYCQNCREFICLNCQDFSHGKSFCNEYQFNKTRANFLLSNALIPLNKCKKPRDKINKVGLNKLLKAMEFHDLMFVDELQGLLKVCILTQILKQSDVENCPTKQIIMSLELHLEELHKIIKDIGSRTDAQIKQIAKDNQKLKQYLKEIYLNKDDILRKLIDQ